ncbi:hypothetical protein [Halioxenophilus sp. WMMB6]|uniref:hypothetical protein n=1 Tax=Halioxenophilus sp. WMMB6 TaxID=3073815 RepID=UPI00295E70E0|nr:hypothetical protein [Halioxenophilus sp. WMMB6]
MNQTNKIITEQQTLSLALAQAAGYIASQQQADGCIPWYKGQMADPWDHVEAAMGLAVGGYYQEAKRAYQWLAANQNSDGSWFSQYGELTETYHDLPPGELRQSHHAAYLATGLWHYWLASGERLLLEELYPCLERAMAFTLALQTDDGDILWAVDSSKDALDDSLITACSAIYKSLDCALQINGLLNCERPDWVRAYHELGRALRDKPERFDRHWSSKKRYAMDWFYPVLSGVVRGLPAQQQLQSRWQEFVVDDLGCLCVNDHPWVTMAESAELCLALASCGDQRRARQILAQLLQFQDDQDGGFWTGYVYTDEALWPEEKTTWTAAAVLLAADALYELTPAANIFKTHHPL